MRREPSANAVVARAALATFALAMGCARTPPSKHPPPPAGMKSPFSGYASAHYRDPKAWLCWPGREDACARRLDATELRPDGARVVVRDRPAPGADKVDCFYVYPTVDLSLGAANHERFEDLEPMITPTIAQAARFRSVCRLFVPLYRQVTIGTYLRGDEVAERYLEVAESDVADAFLHYMAEENHGRKIVLLGHSQGCQIVTRLLKRFFDDDPEMRARLLVAMPIGCALDVAKGRTTGGTFANLPVCTRPGETACVVAYRSFHAGANPKAGRAMPAAGRESICVNPAELAAGRQRPFSRAFIPSTDAVRGFLRGVDNVTTPFVLLRDFYSGACVARDDGFRYLAVSEVARPGDPRVSPVDLDSVFLRGGFGLHILDYQFAQGDLIDLVAQRAAALP